jgi:hypothetical protein
MQHVQHVRHCAQVRMTGVTAYVWPLPLSVSSYGNVRLQVAKGTSSSFFASDADALAGTARTFYHRCGLSTMSSAPVPCWTANLEVRVLGV